MTMISEGHVPDRVWNRAVVALEGELAQVVIAIALVNTWNRLSITTRTEPGFYEAGMLAAAA